MPLAYNLETDIRYNQGLEKGMEKGIEKGINSCITNQKIHLYPLIYAY